MSNRYDPLLENGGYTEWRGAPRRTIMVCSQQRSGSTLLGEFLYFAGGLGCPLEYYHGGFRPSFEAQWGVREPAAFRASLHRWRTDPSGTFGVKLFWDDIADMVGRIAPDLAAIVDRDDPAAIDDAVYREVATVIAPDFPNPVHIALTRDDKVAQAVSTMVAADRGLWRDLRQAHGKPPAQYDFDVIVQTLMRIERGNAHWRRYFAANGIAPIAITYEQLAGDYAGTVAGLLAALGRPDAPIVPPRLKKQADARSEAFIARFRAEFLARTRR